MAAIVDPRTLALKGVEQIVGPWPCEQCGQLSQFASIKWGRNYIYCKNPNCDFERTVDRLHSRIIESDGTVWAFDGTGRKWRVRA